ncbi:unnamed protein product [Ilex paraguariensis]|uniref:Histone deacetylase interacting domain-containing protein n=1 Tax=Ilex paraguariensis TaxID=185542 RepID=A0ABC8S524_9AQUA
MDISRLLTKVKKLFDGYGDLVSGFNSFLPVNYVATSPEIEFINKVYKRFIDDQCKFKSFLEALSRWRFGAKDISLLDQDVAIIFKEHRDLYIEFMGFYGHCLEEKSNDLEENKWVLETPRNKDSRFRNRRLCPYEKKLCDCEDTLFEADMVLHSLESTKNDMEKLVGDIMLGINKEPEREIDVENFFTVKNLRCIERLYHDHGFVAVNSLKQHPEMASMIIASRLDQKLKEVDALHDEFKGGFAIKFKNLHEKAPRKRA